MSVGLHTLVRDALEQSESADPREIAAELAEQIPNRELRGIVRELLPDYVRIMVSHQRRRTPAPATNNNGGTASSRWAAVAERAEEIEIFRRRVCAGGRWLFLGDCTPVDLEALVGEHEQLAAANAQRAASYRRLIDRMCEHGVDRVADLAPETVVEVLDAG